MFQRWIDGKQHICFDIDELFAWQDALDEIEDQEHPAWKLFDAFLWDSECKLEFSEEFLKEMQEIHVIFYQTAFIKWINVQSSYFYILNSIIP